MRPLRRQMQIVFQDPFASLNPRMRVGAIVGEPLRVHGVGDAAERAERVAQLLRRSGCDREQMRNYPHEFSGGQRQRIAIARALALDPQLHRRGRAGVGAGRVDPGAGDQPADRAAARAAACPICSSRTTWRWWSTSADRVAVMYLGRIVERADKTELFARPLHPYTEALLAAVPVPDPAAEAGQAAGGGRRAEPDPPAARLPLPSALPIRRGTLPGGGADVARGRGGAPGGVPPALMQ